MKFNILSKAKNVVTNYEGAKAFSLTPELELYATVVTTGLSDTFYEKADTRLARIRELITKNDPEFVAKLAVYARTSMYLRSVPLVLAVELLKQAKGSNIAGKTIERVIQRADEITELLAYYQAANERKGAKKLNKLSKQLQKGLSGAFNKFDEYQFSKYNRDTEVKFRDALFLVHPKPLNDKQQELFNKIAKKELATAYTWETELSALGQQKFADEKERSAALRAKWEELVNSNKLGYMALLRNLRNMVEAEISWDIMKHACNRLADPVEVAKSKQLPFRFLAAYREIKALKSDYVSMVLNALEDAVVASAKNITGFDEKTRVMIACDVSGSMQKPVSAKSKVQLYDIGLILGMLLQYKCERVATGMFGQTWKIINLPNRGILSNVDEYYKREGEVGYATNGHLVIDDLVRCRFRVDKVMMFTDCQMWDSGQCGAQLQKSWNAYKIFAPKAKLYLFDLAGYGNTPVRVQQNDVYLIAGWSDKVFDVLEALDKGVSAVQKVKEVAL